MDLDRWVPWLPIRTVRVHATDTAPVKRTGAVPIGSDGVSEPKEHIHLRFQAVVIASQLPDNRAEALLVLDYARHMVEEFLDTSPGVLITSN